MIDASYFVDASVYLLGCWLAGYIGGLIIWAVKRMADQM